MLTEKLTRPSGGRMLMVLAAALAVAVALSMAFAGDADAKKKKAKSFTRTSTVIQNNSGVVLTVGAPGTQLTGATPYTFSSTNRVRSINNVSVTLTLAAFFPNDPGLVLGLDGIDTGIPLSGFTNFVAFTRSGGPTNASQIASALRQDGQLVGSVIDRTPGDNILLIQNTSNTTLQVQGKLKKKKNNN